MKASADYKRNKFDYIDDDLEGVIFFSSEEYEARETQPYTNADNPQDNGIRFEPIQDTDA